MGAVHAKMSLQPEKSSRANRLLRCILALSLRVRRRYRDNRAGFYSLLTWLG